MILLQQTQRFIDVIRGNEHVDSASIRPKI